jgi:addiction module RelE/StbE family toxin
MEIKFSAKFQKQYNKAGEKIKKAFNKRLLLFQQDQLNPILRNHVLTGNYKDYRSINITGDWRALFSQEDGIITFEMFGTHSLLYQ